MSRLDDLVEADLRPLLAADEAALMDQLGIRLREAGEDPSSVGRLDGLRTVTSHDQGPDLRSAAERVFRRINREMHTLVCGAAKEDVSDRRRIKDALGMGDLVVASALYQVIVDAGTSPAIATVAAALLVRRIIEPAGQELCKYWAEHLG